MSKKPSVGVIGLAVMGSNLARNIESRGLPVAVFNRSGDVTEKFMLEQKGKNFIASKTVEEFVASMEAPRQIIIMVKAGGPTDAVINGLLPILSPGDIVIDGGNAYYKDTQRRELACKEKKIRFLGIGISGGEEGALKGPSLMPGGPKDAWEIVDPLLQKIAAQADGPCTAYIGPDGAGHFVKMVHNGIEYGDMQLIAEAYQLLKDVAGLSNEELASTFTDWNQGVLSSFLIEITAKIFNKKEGGIHLVDVVLDKAGQKGTGKWTVQEALELGVPIPTLASAVDARGLSSMKEERVAASEILTAARLGVQKVSPANKSAFVSAVHDALYAAKIVAYAQGMALLKTASQAYNWNLDLGSIAAIWKGGCIIRARFLDDIRKAYQKDPALKNLMLDSFMRAELERTVPGLRSALSAAVAAGIAVPAFSSALGYIDAYRTTDLPQNLTQAQRDFFGAHTFERKDKPGVFHAQWE